jgi:hypothetical protein
MRKTLLSLTTVFFASILTGCVACRADFATVAHYGGLSTPNYNGILAECPPLEAIDFSTRRAIVTDDDLAAMLPALKRLQPRRISLGGQPITDRSIDYLNQLDYLQSLSLEGTQVSPEGRGRLRLSHWTD